MINWKSYPNFREAEFGCQCRCGREEFMCSEELVRKLQAVRLLCNFPLAILSAYRCPKHNKRVGGAENSAHIRGTAVDIRRPESGAALKQLLDAIFAVGFQGFGMGAGKLHIDVDKLGNRAWMYGK